MLKDWRRINVSFTRARCKLVIVGSRRTLQSAPLLGEFFALMDGRGWVLALPPGADAHHAHLCDVPPPALSGPRKRRADEGDDDVEEGGVETPASVKRAKRSGVTEEALVKGRHILKDLLNDTQ